MVKVLPLLKKNSKYSSINNCIFFDDSHLEKIIHIDYSRLCDLTNCKFVLPDGFDVDSIIFYEEATLKEKRGNSYISISDWNKPIVPIPDSSGGKIVIPGEDVLILLVERLLFLVKMFLILLVERLLFLVKMFQV